MGTLLFEIGTEELPAGYIEPALVQLEEKLSARFKQLNIGFGAIRTFATPRRLALIVDSLDEKQQDIREEIMGPSVKAGYDAQGKPTKAAIGFAKSKGAAPEDLKVVETEKGDYLMLLREQSGQKVTELLPQILQQLIVGISFPKSMRWGSNELSFARPIQWLLAKFDNAVISFEHEGIATSALSRGHRFLKNHEVEIENGETYENQLVDVDVVADNSKRKEAVLATIRKAVADSEFAGHGKLYIDEDLLDIVTNLVEKPFGVCGRFNEKFLELPDEVLVTSMKVNQKYFPIVNDKGELLAGFVAVNNTKTENEAITRQGHERVLRARLEDALFFYKSDQSRKLEDLVPELRGSIFQAQLGTMLEKNERMVKLARMLAEMLAPDLVEDACRAAQLSKADLLTEMVGEFPSLQGIMGQSYAQLSGEKQEVALAIREHYMPRRSGADVPTQQLGALVGMADRFDTLVGCFGIQQIPTGTADPFGLRRISLAILHIVTKYKYRLSLREVTHKALALYGNKVDGSSKTVDAVVAFIKERYRNDCVAKGFDSEAVSAVTSVEFDDIIDSTLKIEALSNLKNNASFSVLASSFKRIKNIIKDNTDNEVRDELLIEKAEKNLNKQFNEVRQQMQPMLDDRNYFDALEYFLRLKEPVDTFFDEVMVMADDTAIRQNRLNLLTAMSELVLNIGDISKMQEV